MNDSIYEEYMRNVLGYQPINHYNTYDMNYENFEMPNMHNMYNMSAMNNIQIHELENCYPDIYKIVYPMIQKACMQNTRPVTREVVDSMTEEIYFSIEDREMVENRVKDEKTAKNMEKAENRQTIVRNTGLNDLIRILLLRELIGRPGLPGFPGGRPPRPIPPRPPMRPPMRPGTGLGPRPGMGPFNRQVFGQYDDLYEV